MKITLHGRDINGFMTLVLEEICIKANIVKVVNAIRILEEHDKHMKIRVEPWLWEIMLPIMKTYKDKYGVDWDWVNNE